MSGKTTHSGPRHSGTAALIALSFLLLAAGLGAQGVKDDKQPLTEKELLVLHRAGLSAEDLLRVLERQGTLEVDAEGLLRLEKAGLCPAVLKRLEENLRRAKKAPITPADVLGLVQSGVTEEEIIQRITESGSCFDLSLEDVVTLMRQGVPGPVLKVMRERGAAVAEATREATTVSLDDLVTMSAAGLPAAEMLRRIRKVDAHFRVDTDDLIRLSRAKVPQEILKEVWDRRENVSPPTPPAAAPPASAGSESPPPAPVPEGIALTTHREPSGGFSLNVPQAWFIHRESVASKSVLSFTDREVPEGGGLADGEIQVFRYRSSTPDRLTENNLEPIAVNFLGRLQASFAAKKMTFTYSKVLPVPLSGRPALVSRIAATAANGTVHEGEIWVTWHEDQIFLVLFAARADLSPTLSPTLSACARSFTIEIDRTLPEPKGKPEDDLAGLFDAWKDAVRTSDFALYRRLFPTGFDTAASRAAFVALAQRLSAPDIRLSLGKIQAREKDAEVECLVLGPASSEKLTLAFTRDGQGYRMRP